MDRILVVDDASSARRLLKARLAESGYEVIEAADGEDGFRKAQEEKPDLIIADARMPIKDGYQLARDLRSNVATASIPIMMVTGLHGEQDELKAFQEGVDDYVTKPFSAPVLRARVATLLARSQILSGKPIVGPVASLESKEELNRISCGSSELDEVLGGGLPQGSNMLVVGETGSGKSRFCRRFLALGLMNSEPCLIITLDDEPAMIRHTFDTMLPKSVNQYEEDGRFRLVDGYSWSKGNMKSMERFAVSGLLELNQLAGVISDAGMELGHSIGDKGGGRRILDSISSLFVNFELASVQRLITQLARTATSYGGVTTLYIVEEGAITEQTLNNMKYVMDGMIEFRVESDCYNARVSNMKWSKFSRQWVKLEE